MNLPFNSAFLLLQIAALFCLPGLHSFFFSFLSNRTALAVSVLTFSTLVLHSLVIHKHSACLSGTKLYTPFELMVSTDSASCTRFLTGTPPHQAPGTQMGVSLLCSYKRVDVYELYFLNNISGEMVQLKCLTCEKGYHALTASFSICVANRGQCKLNKCLSLWLSLTDLVTAMDSNCRNWVMCMLLAPFPNVCFVHDLQRPCRLWPMLCFSASLCWLPCCSAKGG